MKNERIPVDDLAISMYSKDVSTRKTADILEEVFHDRYSKSTIFRINWITASEIDGWLSRSLGKGYIAIFMNAMSFSLIRETVQEECGMFVMG